MSGLNLNQVCWLFCCPPWPSKIAAKLAFIPPRPSYNFESDSSNSYALVPNSESDYHLFDNIEDQLDCFYATTKKNNLIACMYIKCVYRSRFVLLHSHGNAVDIGQLCNHLLALGSKLNCDIFTYDYSGYGMSGGKPSEKNLYADIEAAATALKLRLGIRQDHIVLYGQSIGTVPTVYLATKYDFAGVVLHSPLLSGVRVVFPNTRRTWFFDAFTSIDIINKVNSPVLVIHGTHDEVIDFNHGKMIFEKCRNPVNPLWIEGAGHNNIERFGIYIERLRKFLHKELRTLGNIAEQPY